MKWVISCVGDSWWTFLLLTCSVLLSTFVNLTEACPLLTPTCVVLTLTSAPLPLTSAPLPLTPAPDLDLRGRQLPVEDSVRVAELRGDDLQHPEHGGRR